MKKYLIALKWGLVILLWIVSFLFGWRVHLWLAYMCHASLGLLFIVGVGLFLSMMIAAGILHQTRPFYSQLCIIPGIMFLLSNAFFFFFCKIFNSIGDRYEGGYIAITEDVSGRRGLMDKFGSVVVNQDYYSLLVRVFSNDREEFVIVGAIRYKKNDRNTFTLYIYDDECRMLKTVDVKESCHGNIYDHILNEIGPIEVEYISCWDRGYYELKEVSYSPPKIDLSKKKADGYFSQDGAGRDKEIEHESSVKRSGSKLQASGTQKSESRETHVPQEVWKEHWKPCTACDRGKCRQCNGRGSYYIGDMHTLCQSCNMTGMCPWCEGRGETLEFYRVWE